MVSDNEKVPPEISATEEEKRLFGQRLEEALADAGMSHEINDKLGKLFGGVSGTTVHYWRHGKKICNIPNGIIIAKTLRISFEWLMTGRGDKLQGRRTTPEAEAVLLVFESADPAEQAQMLLNAAAQAWAKGDEDRSIELREMAEGIRKV